MGEKVKKIMFVISLDSITLRHTAVIIFCSFWVVVIILFSYNITFFWALIKRKKLITNLIPKNKIETKTIEIIFVEHSAENLIC